MRSKAANKTSDKSRLMDYLPGEFWQKKNKKHCIILNFISGPSDENDGGSRGVYNHNVHISINRRIEMPPAFHFPEDQAPPSDLIGKKYIY